MEEEEEVTTRVEVQLNVHSTNMVIEETDTICRPRVQVARSRPRYGKVLGICEVHVREGRIEVNIRKHNSCFVALIVVRCKIVIN